MNKDVPRHPVLALLIGLRHSLDPYPKLWSCSNGEDDEHGVDVNIACVMHHVRLVFVPIPMGKLSFLGHFVGCIVVLE